MLENDLGKKWNFSKNWMQLRLVDTRTKVKNYFTPIDPENVIIYVCGITPYEKSHIGHGRSAINFDLLVRVLKFMGYPVTYIRNYTDIDDKLLKKAHEMGNKVTYNQIAQMNIDDFETQMEATNCLKPTHSPYATECIDQMIDVINILVNNGHAYYCANDVCFSVESFERYGQFSGKDLDQLIAGQRVSVNMGKKDAADFVLWKGNEQSKFWESPFGYGRPGWHIECSAMIHKYCKNRPLDIHGGGVDLVFPHHENEVAQSEAAFSHPLANLWMHNQLLSIRNEKMSKSIGNSLLMHDLFKVYKPMAFRFYILQHSYDTPVDFSVDNIQAAGKAFEKISRVLKVDSIDINGEILANALGVTSVEVVKNSESKVVKFFNEFLELLLDNLNSGAAIGIIFRDLDEIKNWSIENKQLLKGLLEDVLGLDFSREHEEELSDEIKELIQERDQARLEKDFEKADLIREQLFILGYRGSDKKL